MRKRVCRCFCLWGLFTLISGYLVLIIRVVCDRSCGWPGFDLLKFAPVCSFLYGQRTIKDCLRQLSKEPPRGTLSIGFSSNSFPKRLKGANPFGIPEKWGLIRLEICVCCFCFMRSTVLGFALSNSILSGNKHFAGFPKGFIPLAGEDI